jgi:tetratricopeptide (TPR) repeat protein
VLDLIESMTHAIGDATLLIACLGRPELLDRRPDWGGGARNAVVLDLQRLDVDQTAHLAGALAGGALSDDVARRIAERAGGNPLFAEELVRMLTDGATGAPAGGPVIPDTVQAVVTARIDRLPADERRALQAAAVIGRTFWTSAVAQLSGLAVDVAGQVIDALIRKDLIFAHRQSAIADERELAFRHILTRDVAYGMLPRAQRQRAHAEAARWLEARLGERIEESIEILAEHLRLAGDDPRGAVYLRRAASKARRLYANADAIRLYDQALETARRANLTADLPQLYLERGDVHELRGTYPAALADFEAALTAARQDGNTALEAVMENRIGRIHHREVNLDDAERHFQRAAELARLSGDRMTLGLALVDLATVAWDRGDNPAADRTLAEGAGILRQEGDHSGLARALNLRGMVHLAMGNPDQAVSATEEALEAARRAGDRAREATSQSYLGIIHHWSGRPRIGLEYCKASLALAETIGDRRRATYAAEFAAMIDAGIGEWGESLRLGEGLRQVAAEVTPQELPYVYLFLGQVYEEIGDVARAAAAYRECASAGRVNPAWQRMLLLATALAARIEGDQAELNRAVDTYLAAPVEPFIPNAALGMLLLADALLHLGRVEDARILLQARRGLVERLGNPGFDAGVALLEAHLVTSDGARGAAERLLDAAVRGAQEAENVSVLRRALELRVTLLNRDEDRRALRDLLDRLAATLPDDLRAIFRASPRVSPYLL